MKRFEARAIGDPNESIFIVGQSPSHGARPDAKYAWDSGTPSSDLVWEAIEGFENLYLTNVVPYQQLDDETLKIGLEELWADIVLFWPKAIFCLGNFAYRKVNEVMKDIVNEDINIVKLKHPSFVVRFGLNKEAYKKQFRDLIRRNQ